jgi:hypothetical protein
MLNQKKLIDMKTYTLPFKATKLLLSWSYSILVHVDLIKIVLMILMEFMVALPQTTESRQL